MLNFYCQCLLSKLPDKKIKTISWIPFNIILFNKHISLLDKDNKYYDWNIEQSYERKLLDETDYNCASGLFKRCGCSIHTLCECLVCR